MIIGICDDEKIWLDYIHASVKKYIVTNNISAEIYVYEKGESLFQNYKFFDLLFMDIDLGTENGIEITKHIRQIDPKVEIVFLTNHVESMRDAFSVKAYNFLDKDFKYETIEECLAKYFQQIKESTQINISYNGHDLLLNYSDIIMIEAKRNGSFLYLKNNTNLETHYTLSEWESMLKSKRFFRSHKSYIISIPHICNVSKKITLTNQYKALLSRYKHKELISSWIEFSLDL